MLLIKRSNDQEIDSRIFFTRSHVRKRIWTFGCLPFLDRSMEFLHTILNFCCLVPYWKDTTRNCVPRLFTRLSIFWTQLSLQILVACPSTEAQNGHAYTYRQTATGLLRLGRHTRTRSIIWTLKTRTPSCLVLQALWYTRRNLRRPWTSMRKTPV